VPIGLQTPLREQALRDQILTKMPQRHGIRRHRAFGLEILRIELCNPLEHLPAVVGHQATGFA
jgi:hypothetical protein